MQGLERQRLATYGAHPPCANEAERLGTHTPLAYAVRRGLPNTLLSSATRFADSITEGPHSEIRHKIASYFRACLPPLYREIPGFMLNESYAYLENRKCRKNSGLDFRHKLTSIFPSLPAAISGDFWAGPAARSEASLGTPLPQGSKSYAINELDGEPTPSRGSTRPRLQGNHHVDFQRAGRRDQPLRQGKPGRVTTRCGNGGPGSPLHAREGTTVM